MISIDIIMTTSFKTAYLPIHFRSIGIVFILIGIVNLIQLYYLGVLLMLLGIPLLLIHHGVAIDTDKQQIKQYLNIFGLKTGQWRDISDARAIQLIELNESQRMWVRSINRTNYYKVCKLYISMENEHILIMKGDKKRLMEKARKLSELMNVELIDKTS